MAAKAPDPFYDRKPVPNELIDGVGYTGLTSTDESNSRERKYSTDKGDLRKFWNPKSSGGKLDPFYQRKPVPDALIKGVGDTGLTQDEEFLNRERKYSVNGVDVRKFGDKPDGGFKPTNDPYYGRKQVDNKQIVGVGETDITPAEAYENREMKAAMFDLSKDPFQQLTGSGHRASVSAPSGSLDGVIQTQRRRSSAVAPHHEDHHETHHHSGYDGDTKLAPIHSRTEGAPTTDVTDSVNPVTTGAHDSSYVPGTDVTHGTHPQATNTTTTTTTTTTTATHATGSGAGHTNFYDAATKGLDEVGPHDER